MATIESVSWDDGILTVKFAGGDIYDYAGVPEDVYRRYQSSPSKEEFIDSEVKPYFASLRHR